MTGLQAFEQWLPFLSEYAVKATLVLALAGIACALMWRASAAKRHMVWSVAVISILAMPLLGALLPAWQVPVLATAQAPAPASDPMAIEEVMARAAPAASSDGAPGAGALADMSWLPGLVGALFFAGVLIGLLRLLGGFWGAARLGRGAEVVRDPEWLRSAHDAAEGLGLRRPVLLLRTGGAVMPATWGLVWPSVILPSTADQWPGGRREAVLAHELAHVKRFDCLTQALAQLACILLWWHPGIWYAARRMRVERERACDDLVLSGGALASDYASHLLEIARANRTARMAGPALLSIAKRSELESRLLWVLDGARSRTVPSLRAVMLTLAVGLVLVAPLSAMRPGEQGGPVAAAAASVAPSRTGRAAPAATGMDELIEMRSVGVDGAYIAELRSAGYNGLTGRQLAAMKGAGVSGAYAAEMNGAGFGRLTPEQLVSLSSVGVTATYVAELRRQGLGSLNTREVARLSATGVTGTYIDEMKALGLGPLNASILADLHAVGIDAAAVRDLAAAGYGPVTPTQLVRMRSPASGTPPAGQRSGTADP